MKKTNKSKNLSDILVKFSDKQRNVLTAAMKKTASGNLNEEYSIYNDFLKVGMNIFSDPNLLYSSTTGFYNDYFKSMRSLAEKSATGKKEKKPGDKRFKSEEWDRNFFFDYVKELYLVYEKNVNETVAKVKNVDGKTKKKVGFYTKQITDALSPSNYLMLNPELLKLTYEKGGENIIEGLDNFLNDVDCQSGDVDIKMTDKHAFKLGKNIAMTPGKVVFENDLLQLIQYSPATEMVQEVPVLISPPWINKYYILDLNEKISMVKWLTEQGYTVFMISWVNPDGQQATKTYEDYVLEGHIEVLDAIEKKTGVKKVSAIGYCTGGTLLATTAAYLKALKKDRFASLTYMATLIDFSEPGDLGVFIDEKQVENIVADVKDVGYLDGRHLAKTFNMLRPNDLVWSYTVNNYMKGQEPVPFDILYWNSDSTNLPAEMYSFYLQNMYLENNLCKPGGIKIKGKAIDVSKIDTPSYFLTTEEDHIVLWRGSYSGAKLMKGIVRFVLGGSGHVAGVVNPPVKNKYGYRTAEGLPETPDLWFNQSKLHDGSWWTDWVEWNNEYSGDKIKKRVVATKGKNNKKLEEAPGNYVKKTYEKKVKCRENCSCHKESRKGITQIMDTMG